MQGPELDSKYCKIKGDMRLDTNPLNMHTENPCEREGGDCEASENKN